MLSSYDQVIHINDDKYLSFGVAPDEQRVVGLGHVEADLVKILGYLRMLDSGCLLEAIERLKESTICMVQIRTLHLRGKSKHLHLHQF